MEIESAFKTYCGIMSHQHKKQEIKSLNKIYINIYIRIYCIMYIQEIPFMGTITLWGPADSCLEIRPAEEQLPDYHAKTVCIIPQHNYVQYTKICSKIRVFRHFAA
jgi:hypothetical protein